MGDWLGREISGGSGGGSLGKGTWVILIWLSREGIESDRDLTDEGEISLRVWIFKLANLQISLSLILSSMVKALFPGNVFNWRISAPSTILRLWIHLLLKMVLALLKSILWSFCREWLAMALYSLPWRHAFLCSYNLVCRSLPLSPT